MLVLNKLSKYLIYAIGEIVLVVIGILIALQVNNLNQESNQKKVRDSYYLSMIESFDKDLVEIESYDAYIKSSIENINEFKANVATAKSYEEATQHYSSLNYLTADCDLNASIWEALVNSGEIGLIDENIKGMLLDFWWEYADYYESDFANKQHYWDLLKNTISSSESKVSTYSLDVFKDNPALFNEAEVSRNYKSEIHGILFALAFREQGNKTSKYKMAKFKSEIESIKVAMLEALEE